MCGIVGFFDQKNISSSEALARMLRSQVHRGPDAEGCFFEALDHCQVALGHRRLSIIDISAKANQPMTYDQLTMVYNGEVYNFSEIRDELKKEGYSFETASDTEVILKAFHCWRMQAVDKFRGMFSFCIFDKKNKKAYLARDRVGSKPLYYYHDNNTFIFSSEIQSFRYHPHVKPSLCEKSMNLFFQYGYIAAPYTIFSEIKKIKAGHYIEYDIDSNSFSEKKYWSLSSYYCLPKLNISEAEATDQLHNLLLEAFSLRMISDMPVGVFLSGGIDSSLIAAILQATHSQPINTFTMAFHHPEYDESSYSRQVANYLKTHHHEQICTWRDAETIISCLPKMYGEPFADSSAIPTALVAKFAKQKVTVALSGDGGDELFCGYNSYLLNEDRFNKINKLPFKRGIAKLLDSIPDYNLSLFKLNYDLYNRYLKLKSVLTSQNVEDKYSAIVRTFTHYDVKKLLLTPQLGLFNSQIFNSLHSLERMMLFDFDHYLPDNLMVKVDRATMYYSLEGREPLLDHKILEFAAQLPIQMKVKKYILKKILEKYLPVSYFERKKHGFGVPVNGWLRNELRYFLDKYIDKTKIKRQGIFNCNYVAELCQAFLRSKTNDNRIWTLLTFQMWYEEHCGEKF